MLLTNVASFQGTVAQVVEVVTHPFWIFESNLLHGSEVLWTVPVLFLSGLLCSAGGIGGGGVYVTMLMVVGRLAPRDAVPLSKAIVFLGSIASLMLNLRKMAKPSSAPTKSLIDYNICRIVVPSSLLGTLLGVLFNHLAPDWTIVSALFVVLGAMTIMVTRTAMRQRAEEDREAMSPDLPLGAGNSQAYGTVEALHASQGRKRPLSLCHKQDVVGGLFLLFTVVICGVLRAHASACAAEIHGHIFSIHKACHHPINNLFYRNTLEGWMLLPHYSMAIQYTFLFLPICICLAAMVQSSRVCVEKEGWTWREVSMYEAMGVSTGCLAGLVGIGGGLIFSPFFLVLGVEPHVAVATSSTCVIFTSSSTTLQYLLTDRIITSLAAMYGVVNLVASYAGTSFVHFLQDNFQTRKSYITMIVASGVFLSAVLSIVKLVLADSLVKAMPVHAS